jgi:penicillin-binding protein 1A
MYANLIFFGHGSYGVEYAAQLFFKKKAKDLDIGESAFLVAMISNPSKYTPFFEKNKKNSLIKHKVVLYRMVNQNYISQKSADKIFDEFWLKYTFKEKHLSEGKQIIKSNFAPHVLEEIRRFIVQNYTEDFFVKNRGANIYTTIDKSLTIDSMEIIIKYMTYIRKLASYKASREKNKIQIAAIYTVPNTGEIRLMIGGDEFTSENQLNRVYQANRQIGSSIKPFLYLSGLDSKTINPFKVFEDKPIVLEIENAPVDQRIWKVSNYNNEYRGYLNLTEALYRSSNVVAAQVADLIGVDGLKKVISDTLKLDIKIADTRFPAYHSMSLGAIQMTPVEMNNMFLMLANKGYTITPFFISKIVDNKQRIIFEQGMVQPKRIASKEGVYLITNMLKKVIGGPGTAGSIKKNYGLNFDIAGKTGTTQDNRDAWFSGFSSELVGTIWIGHDENISLGGEYTGGRTVAPLWAIIMKKASAYYDNKNFQFGDLKLIRQPVCLLSGKAPVNGKCKYIEEEAYFIDGTEPGEYCNLSEDEEINRASLKGWGDKIEIKEETTGF